MLLTEVVSALRATGDTLRLEVTSGAFELGHLVLHQGALWDADVPGAKGAAAWALLATVPSCQLIFREGVDAGVRTVPEAEQPPPTAAMSDEARRVLRRGRAEGRVAVGAPGPSPASSVGALSLPPAPVPAASGAFSLDAPPAERQARDRFDALFRDGTRAYLKHDFAAAKVAFEACLELRPDDRRVLHNLERLRSRTHE